MATKEALQVQARELYEYFEDCDGGYYPDHGTHRMFEVNVKMHHLKSPDVPAMIATYPKRYQKALTEEFTDNTVQSIYDHWLEDSQFWLMETITSQANEQAMTPEKWHEYAGSKLEAGIPTGYTHLDELPTLEAKQAELNKWIKSDLEMLKAFGIVSVTHGTKYKRAGTSVWMHPHKRKDRDYIKSVLALDGVHHDDRVRFENSLNGTRACHGEYQLLRPYTETNAGFYGRSGGHFCFDIDYDHEQLAEVIDWRQSYDDKEYSIEEAQAVINEALEAQKSVQYVKDYVQREHKSMNFVDYLKEKIDEHVYQLKQEEKRRNQERKEIAQKAKAKQYANITVAQLLESKNETIRRNASSIMKEL